MFSKFKHFGSLTVIRNFQRSLSDTVTISTASGQLKGARMTAITGNEYFSFKGVPYARPPVGDLRFRPPQPLEGWTGVRDALEEGNVCPQKDLIMQDIRGNEDCLYLNVHTPVNPLDKGVPKKPVMVWIHGGAFITGSGNSDVYGPDFIVSKDVILVTLNYRFGILGFLSLEEAGISGNVGLKDQVAAMRWVKQNIAQFGGDPNNITLWGESAGSVSVQYHMLSPMSKGLFHKAISISCSVLNPFGFMETSTSHRRAFRLGEALGCKTDNPHDLLNFFNKQPAENFPKFLNKSLDKESNKKGDAFPFLPTLEQYPHPDDEVFLIDTPINLLEAGSFEPMPYIIGGSSHEGILMTRNVIQNPDLWKVIDEDFEKCIVMPLDINIERHTERARAIASSARKFYYGDEPLGEKDVINYANHTTDTFFSTGVHHSMKLTATQSPYPTYYYEFSLEGDLGLFKKFYDENLPGVCHGDILGYMFTHFMIDHDIDPESIEMKTVNRLAKLFTNFAKSGNPTPVSDSDLSVQWIPTSEANKFAYLSIDKELKMKSQRAKERMDFWNQVYETYGNKYSTATVRRRAATAN